MIRIKKVALGLAMAVSTVLANATPIAPPLDEDVIEALANSNLSREQIAILLAKALGLDLPSTPSIPSSTFDDQLSDWQFYAALVNNLGGQELISDAIRSGVLEVSAGPFPGGSPPPTVPAAQVPEPHIYVLLLTGLSMIGFVARRRKKQEARTAATE